MDIFLFLFIGNIFFEGEGGGRGRRGEEGESLKLI